MKKEEEEEILCGSIIRIKTAFVAAYLVAALPSQTNERAVRLSPSAHITSHPMPCHPRCACPFDADLCSSGWLTGWLDLKQ